MFPIMGMSAVNGNYTFVDSGLSPEEETTGNAIHIMANTIRIIKQ